MAFRPKGQILKKWFSILCLALVAGFSSQAFAAKAIDFSFTDINGKAIKLSDYRGKWVLVNFWAPWCPRCKMDFPNLNDIDARSDFVVLSVAMDYGIDEQSVRDTIRRYNLRFPTVVGGNRRDPSGPAQQIGPVDYYPTSYLYAPDGEIVMFLPGIVSRQKLIAFTEQYVPAATAVAATPTSGVQKASMSKAPARSVQDKKKVTVY